MASVIVFLVSSCMYVAGASEACIPTSKGTMGLDATDMELSSLLQSRVTSSDHGASHTSSLAFFFPDIMSILQSRIETSQSKQVTENGAAREKATRENQTQQTANRTKTETASASSDETYARRSFIGVCVYIALTAACALNVHTQTSQDASHSSSRAREQRWDVAKAFCMFSVVCNHCQKPVGWPDALFKAMFQFEMPAFSFVSGIMAASGVLSLAIPQGKVLPNQKLLNRVRDLILANFTCGTLMFVLSVPYGLLLGVTVAPSIAHAFQPFVALRIPMIWIYWFLISLFIWNSVTPLLCLLRYPICVSVICSLFCGEVVDHDTILNNTMGLFAFFVAGFSLGGGGLSDEEISASRMKVGNLLQSTVARILVGIALTCWVIAWTLVPQMRAWPAIEFYHRRWSDGVGRIASSLLIDAIGVFCILVMSFALPDIVLDVVGTVGSRSLYVYLLHPVMLPVVSKASEYLFEVSNPYAAALSVFTQAVLVMSLLGSAFTQCVTRPFVQPQWLVDLMFHVPKSQ